MEKGTLGNYTDANVLMVIDSVRAPRTIRSVGMGYRTPDAYVFRFTPELEYGGSHEDHKHCNGGDF